MSAFIAALAPVGDIDDDRISAKQTGEAGDLIGEEERWSILVHRVRQGEKEAIEELYRYFYGGIRLFLCRHLGPQELEDKVHDTFVIVLTAIRRGEVRDPGRLTSFVRTV